MVLATSICVMLDKPRPVHYKKFIALTAVHYEDVHPVLAVVCGSAIM